MYTNREAALETLVLEGLLNSGVKAKPKYAGPHPLSGLCYTGAEALYHLLGGSGGTRYSPAYTRLSNGWTHWFLVHNNRNVVLDPTVGQFKDEPNYKGYTKAGFLTKQPSKRAQLVIDYVLERI